jgi:hypothetical protein
MDCSDLVPILRSRALQSLGRRYATMSKSKLPKVKMSKKYWICKTHLTPRDIHVVLGSLDWASIGEGNN